MVAELRIRNQAGQIYSRALSAAYRGGIEIHDPSIWAGREPEIEDKMLRDADIAHAVQYRKHLIAGRRWNVEPQRDGSPTAPLSTFVATELLATIKDFTNARLNLSSAFFSGSRFGFIHGRPKILTLGDGQPRTWWLPERIEDMDKRSFRLKPDITEDSIGAHWQRYDIQAQEFVDLSPQAATRLIRHVYNDDQGSLGHGRGLRDALGWWWYAKQNVFDESLQASERFAQGILTAAVDGARDSATGLPNEEVITAWKDVLEDLRARNVLVHDKADEVSTVQVQGEGWQLMKDLRDEFRSTIYTLVMGANLTTSANEGGSYALAAVQENSTEALIQTDRESLEETLTRHLMGCVWKLNHRNLVDLGIHNDMPKFSLAQEKREDPLQRAQVAQTVSAMGVPISVADVRDQTGFKKPEDGEELVKPPAPTMDPLAALGQQFKAGAATP